MLAQPLFMMWSAGDVALGGWPVREAQDLEDVFLGLKAALAYLQPTLRPVLIPLGVQWSRLLWYQQCVGVSQA